MQNSGNNALDIYVQYGCGSCAFEGWRNFDSSPTLWFERLPLIGRLYTKNEKRFATNIEYGNIVRGLPIVSASCAGVYACHVLEHLALDEFRIALRNTYEMLSAGGIFRLIVPDLEAQTRHYLNSSEATAAHEFMRYTFLGVEKKPKGLREIIVDRYSGGKHLFMWDFKALEYELASAGFVNIRKASINDSDCPMMRGIESESRYEGAVAVECCKPAQATASKH
jgi:hypothetical protein